MILYKGYALITPSGLDENDRVYYLYRIYKATPLTSLTSDESYASADAALDAAKKYVDEKLTGVPA